MFKTGLENRDFCISLHFYIVDAGKQIFQSLKNDSTINLALYACFTGLFTSLAGTAGLFSDALTIFFLVLRGACQRPDIYKDTSISY